jgi:hypothetical protein
VIISHQHRFVFVKTHKTAGTSIEAFLGRIAGDDAVVTPVDPPVEGHRARNFRLPSTTLGSLAWRARGRHRKGTAAYREAYYNHISARGARRHLGARRWDSYYTFCFERNPWEKAVSGYWFARGRGAFDGSFRDYVLTAELWSDFDLYSFDGTTIGVDFVGRYEHLADDLQQVLDRLGLSEHELTLTREKGNYRPADTSVNTMFDDDMNARVEQLFAREIAAFGYTPPERLTARDAS